MLIAFEGPDNVGKSTSAAQLSYNGQPIYNATKENYEEARRDLSTTAVPRGLEPELVQTFDRIDWFSHMVYRLALPDREWNDERVRTVFGMPDTHLVVRLHRPDTADFTADEVVDTPIKSVNETYYLAVDMLGKLNYAHDYNLFKSITVMEVVNVDGKYEQRVIHHDSPGISDAEVDRHMLWSLVDSNEALLDFLRRADQHIG